MNRIYIISNYNYDPTEVIESLDADYILYQQGDDSKVPDKFKKLPNYKIAKHTGHNISDYLEYIISNYDNLPEEVGFIKGNIFPRHMQKDIFESRIKERGFVPLYSDENTYKPQFGKRKRIIKEFVAQQIAPGIYLEIANDWYISSRQRGKHYPTLDSLFYKITNRKLPEYISFAPGACMIVEKEKILRFNLDLYKELYEAVTYNFFPVEAYHLERCMFYLFSYLRD